MKHITFIFLTIILTNTVFSQTGPGGVGGSSNLDLWLNIDNGLSSTVNGTGITSWNDQSGHGNHATQSIAGNKPTYQTNMINGRPVLMFDGVDDWMGITINVAETNKSKFIVFQTIGNDGNGALQATVDPVVPTSGSYDRDFGLLANKAANRLWNNEVISSTVSYNDDVTHVINANYDISLSGQQIYVDGALQASGIKYSSDFDWETGQVIGGHYVWGYLNCYIMEIIEYSNMVNLAEQIIIENYLTAKYNSPLTNNNIYNKDDAINGDYDYDVAGIGRVNSANIHNDAQGTGIVRILNPSGLGDNEFLIWGHDNGIEQAAEIVDVPASVQARFDRVWRVSEANSSGISVDIGAIDIRFDLSSLGAITLSDLRLLVDTDNDGVFIDETPITGATDIGGNVFQFSGVTAISDDLRFTLGTVNSLQTPLPIELLNFSATQLDNESVSLDWQTATEINNDYFTIERSENGLDWNELYKIDGAGNSSDLLSYSRTDKHPLMGLSYYRLKQTDLDGEFEYSKMISVNVIDMNNLQIFPNPTNSYITIMGKEVEFSEVIVYNTLGQDVTELTKEIITNGKQLVIDLSELNTGFYYIKTKNTSNKVYKE